MHPERELLNKLLVETITTLCRNSLKYKTQLSVDGLIGITIDQQDVFLVKVRPQNNKFNISQAISFRKAMMSEGGFLAQLWGAYAIPVVLSGVCPTSCVLWSTITIRKN